MCIWVACHRAGVGQTHRRDTPGARLARPPERTEGYTNRRLGFPEVEGSVRAHRRRVPSEGRRGQVGHCGRLPPVLAPGKYMLEPGKER